MFGFKSLLPLLCAFCTILPAQAHSGDQQQELKQLHQMQHELLQEVQQLQQQLKALDQEQLQYLEQSQRLRRQLLKQHQQTLQPVTLHQ